MIEHVKNELKGIKNKKILLQIPEGLKHRAGEIVSFLERQGNKVYLDIDPCFGACDVRIHTAKEVGADLIVHIGHAPFPTVNVDIPVKYVEIHLSVNTDAVVAALQKIPGKIALCTTVQYVHALEEIKKKLPEKVVFGKGTLAVYPGQVLGCDASACAVEADANVFLGDGRFHAIAMYAQAPRRTYVVSPSGHIKDVTEECVRFLRCRKGMKMKAYEAKKWAIVVSTKQGQMRKNLAEKIQNSAIKAGKRAHILVCDYFFPDYVRGMPYDVYVFTGCPRVALDDWHLYDKPVITSAEALEVLKWADGAK